ncbi:alpha-D-xyloside xylohydrolase [Arthrobacter sp. UYP6]|uniref:alpha-xylosidase n=1 Tax=Arthrobacter sp. UYP6 TaxID=1756378 RepID=UPI0033976A1C
MKFSDGFWETRPGVHALYAQEAYDVEPTAEGLTISAPTKVITRRGDTLNRTLLTVDLTSPLEGVVGVRISHHRGAAGSGGFDLLGTGNPDAAASVDEHGGVLDAGPLRARITHGHPWNLSFEAAGRTLTTSGPKAVGYLTLAADAAVAVEPVGPTGVSFTGRPPATTYLQAKLSLDVGELVYGLGERFGPLVKNGQTVDVWNADGGTASEQSYKSIPFYLTNKGYGVFVNHPEHVSFEVGTESVEEVAFSVAGESLEYFVIYGPSMAEILRRYTALTGRPARVPAWSYGLWLSTSFTTDYDEATVNHFVDGMAERGLPLSVFHFDCFWMREFNWTDFEWDPRVFPEPEKMLKRLHEKGLKVSAWINPYIAQRSPLFDEAANAGYLVKKADGEVWQWDMWQAGMGLVDFTNPAATAWYQDKLRHLIGQGVDSLKTDFGERIPTGVVWHNGAQPEAMHNWYTQLYNKAVFQVLEEQHGAGNAVLFARSATAGGQQMPVHWGGDNSSSFRSMAETLRGGLSLALSGFGFWSHDIGGFEGNPDPAVFKRWVAFGLLSSHSRLHGSTSYRVPWAFDTGEEPAGLSAVDVTRKFARLKMSLMPYFYEVGRQAHEQGLPFMRPLQLEFPGDPAVDYLDRQYLIGESLLVAPVFSAAGDVTYYLPAGTWTNYFTGETVPGGAWRTEQHAFDSLPLWVRGNTVLVTGSREDRPDYDYTDNPLVTVYPALNDVGPGPDGGTEPAAVVVEKTVRITNPGGAEVTFTARIGARETILTRSDGGAFRARLASGDIVNADQGKAVLQ